MVAKIGRVVVGLTTTDQYRQNTANITDSTQPLDKGEFGPLQVSWRKTWHNFMSKHPGPVMVAQRRIDALES